jgi:sec-independent protein translocase protein TatA
MPTIGPLELVIVLVIVLIIFGARRIPEVGRSLGTGMREFKDGILGRNDEKDEAAPRAELEAAEPRDPAPSEEPEPTPEPAPAPDTQEEQAPDRSTRASAGPS